MTEKLWDSKIESMPFNELKELQLKREQERQDASDRRQKLVRRRTYEELKQEFEID